MTPITPGPGGPSGIPPAQGFTSLSGPGVSSRPLEARASPVLNLRTDLRNPIRTNPNRSIKTLGGIRDAIVQDFISGKLRLGKRGAQVVQQLGSFPGFLHPDRSLADWKPDQKPDVNVLGDSQIILERLAPLMGWNAETLAANQERARAGMVYFNLAIETPQGPVPFKMGILDSEVWRRGETYFSLRASLLPPREGTSYVFLDGPGGGEGSLRAEPSGVLVTREEFNKYLSENYGRYLTRNMDTFLFRRHFSMQELVDSHFRVSFQNYESYRIFDWAKGPRQAERLRPIMPQIMIPGLQNYLLNNTDLVARWAPDPRKPQELQTLSPEEITPENFWTIQFRLRRSPLVRLGKYLRSFPAFLLDNLSNGRQTFRNIASNKTSRPSHHKVSSVNYGVRKFGRLLGIHSGLYPRDYLPEVSQFPMDPADPTVEIRARLGQTGQPVQKLIILAGHDSGNESSPEVYQEILRYVRAELNKGSVPNWLFRGIDPSKFNLPLRGIPSVYYQLTNALYSQGAQETILVGAEDTRVVLDIFLELNAEEISRRGKTFKFVPQTDTMTGGMRAGYEAFTNQEGPVVVGFGDTPLIDLERMIFHPRRFLADWVVSPNSRTAMTHDGYKNYHVEGMIEGVSYPVKEGNLYIYPGDPSRVPWDLLQAIFDSRKSMTDGQRSKGDIVRELLFGQNWGDARRYPPRLFEGLYFGGDVVLRFLAQEGGFERVGNLLSNKGFYRLGGFVGYFNNFNPVPEGKSVPPAALSPTASEYILSRRLNLPSSVMPNHSDPGGVLDLDGLFDLVLGKLVIEETQRPERVFPYWDKIADHAQVFQQMADRLPTINGTAERVNKLNERLRIDLTAEGMDVELLRSRGFAADVLPLLPDARVNSAYVDLVIGSDQAPYLNRAFEAYYHRGEHARSLPDSLPNYLDIHQRPVPVTSTDPAIESFVLGQLNIDPEQSRSLLIEQSEARLTDAILAAGRERFGPESEEFRGVERYLEQSLAGRQDTTFRRVLTGMKGVEVLRRNVDNLSPLEYQRVFPLIVESIGEAQEAIPTERGGYRPPLSRRRRTYQSLLNFFSIAQQTADSTFVQKVGESPPEYRSRGNAKFLPHSNSRVPVIRNGRGDVLRADSGVMLPADFQKIALDLNILPSRVPNLIAAAAGARTRQGLAEIPRSRITAERVLQWVQNPEGQNYMRTHGARMQDTFANRVREGGPGLGISLASLLVFEHLADELGIDRQLQPHERFAFVVGASHLVGVGTGAVNEVLVNRSLRSPFSYVTTRSVNAGGEAALQFSYEARHGFLRGSGASLVRNFGLQGGVGRSLINGTRGVVTLPFRTAWNMGPGLMSSAITNQALRLLPDSIEPQGQTRQWINFGSFFIPDAYRIAVGPRGPSLFRTSTMRFASRAFAAGFMADMAFLGANRLYHGSGSSSQNRLYQQANQLNDEDSNGFFNVVDGAFEMLAPSLMSWWDSVEFRGLSLRHNRYYHQAASEARRASEEIHGNMQSTLRNTLIQGRGEERFHANFYTHLNLDFLRGPTASSSTRNLPTRNFARALRNRAFSQRFQSLSSPEGQIRFLQRHYRGWHLSRNDVETMLTELGLRQMRSELAGVHSMPLRENSAVRTLFDSEGNLQQGFEAGLLREVFGQDQMTEEELLQGRRVALAVRILYLREGGPEREPGERNRLEGVARQVEVLEESGGLTSGSIRQEAIAQWHAQRTRMADQGISFSPASS